jgi:hypothetical protein
VIKDGGLDSVDGWLDTYSRKITDLQSGKRGRDSEIMSGLLDNNKPMLKVAMGEAELKLNTHIDASGNLCACQYSRMTNGWHEISGACYDCRCRSCWPHPI